MWKIYETLCLTRHLYNLKNMKNTYGAVLLLVELQAVTCSFTKSNTSPWFFFTFFKLCKWYRISQSLAYALDLILCRSRLSNVLPNYFFQGVFLYCEWSFVDNLLNIKSLLLNIKSLLNLWQSVVGSKGESEELTL